MRHVAYIVLLLALLLAPPAPAQPTGATLVTSALNRPVGLTLTSRFGRPAIYVATTGQGASPNGGRIMIVSPTGAEVFPLMTGLPTGLDAGGNLRGVSHLLVVDDDVWFTSSTSSTSSTLQRFSRAPFAGSPPLTPAAINLTVDVGAFLTAQGYTNTNPYALVVGPDGAFYFTDAGANALLRYDSGTGTLTIHAAFPPVPNPSPVGPPIVDAVPTGVVSADGRLYVSALTGFPFVEGLARVYAVEMNGNVSVYRSGLSALVDLALDPRGDALTALQHGAFALDPPPPHWVPATGRALRLNDDLELAAAFDLPSGAAYDDDGTLFVTTLGGSLYRVNSPPVASEPPPSVADLGLRSPVPNPSGGAAMLGYELGRPSVVRLAVYDALGREVALLEEGEREAGPHEATLDVSHLAPGVYLLRLTADGAVADRRFTVAR